MELSIGMIEKSLYRLICSFLLACIFAFHFGPYLGICYEGATCAFILCGMIFLVSLFVFLVEKYKWVAIVTALAVGIAASLLAGWSTVYEFISGYVTWAFNGAHINGAGAKLYSLVQLVWIGMFSYGLQVVTEKIFYLKLILGTALAGLLAYFLFSGYEASQGGVVFSLAFLVLVVAEWTESGWKKEKKHHGNAYMLRIMLFIGGFFLLTLWMPVSNEPYEWEFVKEAMDYCGEKLQLLAYDIFQEEDTYDLALSGFSDEAKLGAGIVEDDREIMQITCDRDMRTNLYLAGKYFNTFENMEWSAYQQEEYYDRNIDTLQTSYAVLKYGSQEINLALMKITLDIVYQDLNTVYLFAPGKLYTVEDEEKQNIDYIVEDGSIFFHNNQNYGSGYQAVFYQMNSSIQPFIGFLETPVEYDEALWNRTLTRYQQTTGTYIKYEQIEDYEQRCYDDYTTAPVLSSQVQEYLDEVTEGCESDIDTLLAIENELSSYTYTTTPGELPEDAVDETGFLDYFLLDSQKGYCTYYATAFVLLARAEGFPARYVQGYCVPMYGDRSETVLSSMAHAWPEVYLEDIGWVAFEPTPGYSENRSFEEEKEDYVPYGSNYYAETNQENMPEEENTSQETDAVILPEITDNSENIKAFPIKLLLFVLSGLILALIFVTLGAKLLYKRKPVREQYLLKVKRNFKLLAVLGLKMSETETPAEYSKRTGEALENAVGLEFVSDYEDVIYGNKTVDEMLVNRVDGQYKEGLLYLKKISYCKYLQYRVFKILRCDVT